MGGRGEAASSDGPEAAKVSGWGTEGLRTLPREREAEAIVFLDYRKEMCRRAQAAPVARTLTVTSLVGVDIGGESRYVICTYPRWRLQSTGKGVFSSKAPGFLLGRSRSGRGRSG